MREETIIGCLLGTAIGDALGLPCEGLTRERQRRLFPDMGRYHLLFNRGMVSDDTDHTAMVAQALIVSNGEVTAFARSLAWQFRLWLLGLPAGVGLATLRAILKLWLGFGPARNGVFSAGNAPAMRSAIIGVCFADNGDKRRALVRASSRLTHTDPKADWRAQAVALASALASRGTEVTPQAFLAALEKDLEPEATEFLDLVRCAVISAYQGQTTQELADAMGLHRGISGYVYHTVPIVLQTWLRHQEDFCGGVEEIIRCGGDTDTTAAIVGALIGARVGHQGIPPDLLRGLWEWPHSVAWMEELGRRLVSVLENRQPAQRLSAWGVFPRNLLFLLVILTHGFRRLLPPY